ncbi:MAG: hypothetical protein ABI587_16690 [Gemmatimonadales bacterium]
MSEPWHRLRLAAALLLSPTAAHAQESDPPNYPTEFSQPMPLYTKGLGTFTWKISTRSAESQAYFNQGIQLMYAFALDDAARSFREAWQRDSACAMCYWGEALAWGPYLNEGMGPADAPRAFRAISHAVALADPKQKREYALIVAQQTRYQPTQDSVIRKQLDSTYARAMKGVAKKFPKDAEVGTLYAESLMLLEPRRGTWELSKASVREIHQVLEHILARDITHPGACHLYIHATESTTEPGKPQACAVHLGHAVPGASHLNHMPSHTYNRVGRWHDAVRANLTAWHSDQAALVHEGFAIYPSHNLHMLLYAASYGGEGAIADQAARDYAVVVRDTSTAGPSRGSFYQALVLLRFGRFAEVLTVPGPTGNAIQRGLGIFARGYAQLKLGHADSAEAMLQQVDSLATSTPDSIAFRGHTARKLLGITGGILRAELLQTRGATDSAIAVLQQAVALEDSLTYDEPEPLPFSARHWLGAHLLEAGRPAEAEVVYRAELLDHPRNGWSLTGLAQALRALGRNTEADVVERDLASAWSNTDVWVRGSRE